MRRLLIVILCIYLLFIFLWGRLRDYEQHHWDIFDWYCKNYYDFRKDFSDIEMKYISECIRLSKWELFRVIIQRLIGGERNRLSFFTYSVKVSDGKPSYDRLCYGTLHYSKYLEPYAREVLDERGISWINGYQFYGLGYDGDKFKVYYRFDGELPIEFRKLARKQHGCHKWGLFSKTYNSNGKELEKKVYLYDLVRPWTYMICSKRGIVIQIDHNNDNSNKIIDKDYLACEFADKWGYSIDTYVYKNKNNYALYFPH